MNPEEIVRLGIVRCDTHAYYFGMMLDECDPMLLLKNNFVVHHYATDIYNPRELSKIKRIPGFKIVKAYDEKIENAKDFSDTFYGIPAVCESIGEMTEGIDAAFICDCDGGGGDHLKYSLPFIKKGIPAFIDKPFASTLHDSLVIIDSAKKYNTPIMNASILSHVPVAEHFRNRFREIDPVGLGVIKGVGGAFSQELEGKKVTGGIEERLAYIIHGISLGINLFGKGVEWVEAMGTLPLEYLHMHLRNGIEVMVMNTSIDIFPESCSFYADAYSRNGALHSYAIGDPEFLAGGARILELFKAMIENGRAPIPYEDIIEHIAVVEAGIIAQNTGKRVYIDELIRNTKI